jgi:hypothetical protein
MHIAESVIDGNRIDPHKIDLMGRMGRAYYVRASGKAVHTIVQSVLEMGIGFDGLPESAKNSNILTGNQLGFVAGLETIPDNEKIEAVAQMEEVKRILSNGKNVDALHELAGEFINAGDREAALAVLIFADRF